MGERLSGSRLLDFNRRYRTTVRTLCRASKRPGQIRRDGLQSTLEGKGPIVTLGLPENRTNSSDSPACGCGWLSGDRRPAVWHPDRRKAIFACVSVESDPPGKRHPTGADCTHPGRMAPFEFAENAGTGNRLKRSPRHGAPHHRLSLTKRSHSHMLFP